jgi:tetratricopeptide (TPR) repeat protein
MLMGFYDAVVDLANRGYALLDWTQQPEECWRVTSKLTMAHVATGRPDEAAALYDQACMQTPLPKIHLHASYGRAMLHARFLPPERRDRAKAKAHINTAIALSSQLPDAQRRAFDLSFNENGLALIETYLGDPERALELVDGGLASVESEVGDASLLLHRSVLRYNRAQLLSRMGRRDEALVAYAEAIEADPNQSEYHLERGHLLRRLGRREEALAGYEAAIRTSPPYPEPITRVRICCSSSATRRPRSPASPPCSSSIPPSPTPASRAPDCCSSATSRRQPATTSRLASPCAPRAPSCTR